MDFAPLTLPLLRAAAWLGADPGDPALAPGTDGFLDLADGEPDVAFVDRMQRRRLSTLARAFFHCARRLQPPPGAPVVFASRHGESERNLVIFQDLAAGTEVSPTLFSLSVHNAVPGLWSIQTGNRAPVAALAAGPDTFPWGLVEALATFRSDPSTPVLFVYADDALPDPWADPAPRGLPHALGLLLGEPAGRRLTLARDAAAGADREPHLPPSLHCLRALRAGSGGAWAGPDGAWAWTWQ
jgi:hypothetical protein